MKADSYGNGYGGGDDYGDGDGYGWGDGNGNGHGDQTSGDHGEGYGDGEGYGIGDDDSTGGPARRPEGYWRDGSGDGLGWGGPPKVTVVARNDDITGQVLLAAWRCA